MNARKFASKVHAPKVKINYLRFVKKKIVFFVVHGARDNRSIRPSTTPIGELRRVSYVRVSFHGDSGDLIP